MGMNIYRVDSYDAMSEMAAGIICRQMKEKPDSVLGLATGSTPVGMYRRIVELYGNGEVDFSKAVTFNLDEYRGLGREDEQSYYRFMHEKLFSHINIKEENTHIPDGTAEDGDEQCRRYEEQIRRAGGIDLQVLGIGHNGHIGFNEPADYYPVRTHCVDLSESTIEANRRFFTDINEVPKQAYTTGIGTIMRAKRILLLACGEDKADILARALTGEVTPRVPASILQFHPDVTVVADAGAAKYLCI